MRGIPTSQIRQPLFSRVALASSLPAGAAVVAYIAATEAHGIVPFTSFAVALLVGVAGVRLTWLVAKRETERLP